MESLTPAQATDVLAALAQETRLNAFRQLVTAGPEGLPAGVLSAILDVPPATLSFHLAALCHTGLIAQRRAGRQIIYSASAERMRALFRFLAQDCCGGRPEMCGLLGPSPAANCQPECVS